MTTDAYLDALRADWRGQDADLGRIRRLTDRRRRLARLAMAGRLAGVAAALLFGAWYVRLALTGGPPIYALSAAMLLLAAPLILAEYAGARRAAAVDYGDTPAGVLRQARHQLTTSRRLLWGCRVAAAMLAISAAGVAGLYAAGLASAAELLWLAPVWGITALLLWLWQARRGRRLGAEADGCARLLAELSEAEAA